MIPSPCGALDGWRCLGEVSGGRVENHRHAVQSRVAERSAVAELDSAFVDDDVAAPGVNKNRRTDGRRDHSGSGSPRTFLPVRLRRLVDTRSSACGVCSIRKAFLSLMRSLFFSISQTSLSGFIRKTWRRPKVSRPLVRAAHPFALFHNHRKRKFGGIRPHGSPKSRR